MLPDTGLRLSFDHVFHKLHLRSVLIKAIFLYMGRRKNFTGQKFWARGYHVSTVGRDEEVIRNYIRHQESEDGRIEQLDLY